jgi:phosphonoacetaldehyde hydrolase
VALTHTLTHITATVLAYASYLCSVAPVTAFVEVFKRAGIVIDQTIARGPMGFNKRDHIKAILAVPSVAQQWREKRGAAWSENDVDGLYHAFTPIQIEVVKRRAEPIPGAISLIANLRKQGVKVGSCSGYNEPIMKALQEEAAKHGLTTDVVTWWEAIVVFCLFVKQRFVVQPFTLA